MKLINLAKQLLVAGIIAYLLMQNALMSAQLQAVSGDVRFMLTEQQKQAAQLFNINNELSDLQFSFWKSSF